MMCALPITFVSTKGRLWVYVRVSTSRFCVYKFRNPAGDVSYLILYSVPFHRFLLFSHSFGVLALFCFVMHAIRVRG